MGMKASVGIGVKIRVFILFLLGTVFTLPALAIIAAGFMEPDITADDTLAMFFMGGMLLIVGLTIWWTMRRMYRDAKIRAIPRADPNEMMALGMAQAHYMSSMDDMDSFSEAGDVDTGYDSGGGDFDAGGD